MAIKSILCVVPLQLQNEAQIEAPLELGEHFKGSAAQWEPG